MARVRQNRRFGVTQEKDRQNKFCSTLIVPYSLLWDNLLGWKALLSLNKPRKRLRATLVQKKKKKEPAEAEARELSGRLFKSIMTQQAAALQAYNNELVKCKTSLSWWLWLILSQSFCSRCWSWSLFKVPPLLEQQILFHFLVHDCQLIKFLSSLPLVSLPAWWLCPRYSLFDQSIFSFIKKERSKREHWCDNSLTCLDKDLCWSYSWFYISWNCW